METLKIIALAFAILFGFILFLWISLAVRNLIKIYFDAWEERRK